MLFSFEKNFGKGVDPWYNKAERWVKKKFKNPLLRHLGLGIIAWLKKKWIYAKIENTMREVDAQADLIVKEWQKNEPIRRPKVVERGVFGDEGWSLEISTRTTGERTEESIPKLDPPSDVQRLESEEGDQRSRTTKLPEQSGRILSTNERSRNINIPDPWINNESGTDKGDVEKGFSN